MATKLEEVVAALSSVSGLSKTAVVEAMEKAQANSKALNACQAPHDFQPVPGESKLRKEFKCTKCGGTIKATDFYWYAKGLKHGQGG